MARALAAGFSPELLRDDAAALIEALGLEAPILVGRSNGAVTAALDCPVLLLGGDVQMGSMVSDDVAQQLLDGWA